MLTLNIIKEVLADLGEVIIDAMIITNHQRIVTLYRVPAVLVCSCVCRNGWAHMVYVSKRKLVMDFADYEVLGELKPSFWICLCQMHFKSILHTLEYFQAFLMPWVNLSEQWVVVSCVLMQYVIFDNDHLELFHVEACVHLNCALVNHFDNAAVLLTVWLWLLVIWLGTALGLVHLLSLAFFIITLVLRLFSIFV